MKQRRFLAAFLALVMVLTLIPINGNKKAMADMAATDGITYDVTDSGLVTGYNGADKATITRIVIPQTATGIATGAFYSDEFPCLTEMVVLNDSIKIADKAFGVNKSGITNSNLVVWCNTGSTADTYAAGLGLTVKALNTKDIDISGVTSDEVYSGCNFFKLSTIVSAKNTTDKCDDIIWQIDKTAYDNGIMWFLEDGKHVSETSGTLTYKDDGTTESIATVYVINTTDMTVASTSASVTAICRGTGKSDVNTYSVKRATSTITPHYVVYKPIRTMSKNGSVMYAVKKVGETTYLYEAEKVKEGDLTEKEQQIFIDAGYFIVLTGETDDNNLDYIENYVGGQGIECICGKEESTGNIYDVDAEDGKVTVPSGLKPIILGMADASGNKIDCDSSTLYNVIADATTAVTFTSKNRVLTRKIDIKVGIPAGKLRMFVDDSEYISGGSYSLLEDTNVTLSHILEEPTSSNDTVEWSTDNPLVASVSGRTLNIHATGDVRVTCKVKNIEGGLPTGIRVLSASFNLAVKKKVWYKEIVFANSTKDKTVSDIYVSTNSAYKPVVCDARDGVIYVAPYGETPANEPLQFTSSNTKIASVDSKSGEVTTGAVSGNVTISVVAPESGVISSFTLHVYSPAQAVNINSKQTVVCGQVTDIPYSFTPADATEDIVWTSADPTIATAEDYVDGNGKRFIRVTGKKIDTVEISGRTYSDVNTKITITVEPAVHADTVSVSYPSGSATEGVDEDGSIIYNVIKGTKIDFTPVLTSLTGVAVNDKFIWTMEESQTVCTVDVTTAGVLSLTGNKTGKTQVTLIAYGFNIGGNGESVRVEKTMSFYINIYAPASSVAINFGGSTGDIANVDVGAMKQVYATITPSDCLEAINWSMDNDNVVLSTNRTLSGKDSKLTLEAVKTGRTVLTATTDSGKTSSVVLNVIKPFSSVKFIQNGVETTTIYVIKGGSTQVSLDVLDADTSDTSFTWNKPNDLGIVSIAASDDGKSATISASMQGTQTVTVTANSSKKQVTAKVVVLVPSTSMTLSSNEISLYKSESVSVAANLGPDSCTDIVRWTMDREGIVQITEDTNNTTSIKKAITVKGLSEGTVTLTATTVSGITKSVTLTVTAKNIAEATISNISDLTYDNTAKMPSVTVKIGDKTLTKSTNDGVTGDYTVNYSNNINAGDNTATVTVTGVGNYTGTIAKTFTIKPRAITSANVPSIATIAYNGNVAKPELVITDFNKTVTLTEGKDYSLVIKDNINAGKATVTLTGMGNYTGIKETSFTIGQKDFASSADIKATTVSAMTYTGSALKPAVVVKDGIKVLKEGSEADYTMYYSSNTYAGTATIKITGRGNYKGTKTITFTIKPRSIATAVVSKIDNQNYTGSELKPGFSVKMNDKTVSYDKYYYTNIKPGKATIKIVGKGNYTGTIYKSFVILPLAPTAPKMSANSTSTITLKWTKALGATGYYIYKQSGTKYVKVGSTTSNTYKVSKLSAGKDYSFQIYSYVKIGTKNYLGKKNVAVKGGTKTAATAIKKISSKNNAVSLTLKKVTGASRYNIYCATSKGGKYKLASSTSSITASVSGLKTGKTYYFKIKVSRRILGKDYFSSYSSIKSIKVKK